MRSGSLREILINDAFVARKRPAADGDGAAAAPAAPAARLRLAPELADVAAAEREVDRFIVTAARTDPAAITANPLAWLQQDAMSGLRRALENRENK